MITEEKYNKELFKLKRDFIIALIVGLISFFFISVPLKEINFDLIFKGYFDQLDLNHWLCVLCLLSMAYMSLIVMLVIDLVGQTTAEIS